MKKLVLEKFFSLVFFRMMVQAILLTALILTAFQRNSVWKDKVGLWQDAVSKSPGSYRAHFNLGVAYENNNRFVEAEASLKRCLRIKASHNRARYYLSEALFNQGKYEETSQLLRELIPQLKRVFAGKTGNERIRGEIKATEEYWVFYYRLGVCYYHLNRFTDALTEFVTALQFASKRSDVLNQMGLTYNEMKRYREAEKAWTDALLIDPSFGLAHESLGRLYLENLPDKAKARLHLEETLRFFPDHPSREWIEQKLGELAE